VATKAARTVVKSMLLGIACVVVDFGVFWNQFPQEEAKVGESLGL
jgi:hypothetical protein